MQLQSSAIIFLLVKIKLESSLIIIVISTNLIREIYNFTIKIYNIVIATSWN